MTKKAIGLVLAVSCLVSLVPAFLMGSQSLRPVSRARAKFTYRISTTIAYTSAQEPLHIQSAMSLKPWS